MKFREHRGMLDESMETVIEVNSIHDLYENIKTNWERWRKSVCEIKFEYACYDERIDWDTYYVMAKFEGEENYIVVGMSDGLFYTDEDMKFYITSFSVKKQENEK